MSKPSSSQAAYAATASAATISVVVSSEAEEANANSAGAPAALKSDSNYDNQSINDSANATKLSICRFLIKDLQASRGYAKSDYRIDLIKTQHGLYDLASLVFDILRKEKMTQDSIYSHLWDLKLGDGVTFRNGWRRKLSPYPDETEYDRPASKYDLDEGERRLLNGLVKPIESGQKGWCSGESLKFQFIVEDADLEVDMTQNNNKAYPRVTSVPIQLSTKIEDDWINSEQKQRCNTLRSTWTTHMQGMNSWKRDRRTREWIPGKCIPPNWGGNETEIMGLLLKSGAKFKKSWTNIMQYAFVDRAETAASGQWYKLQKETYRWEYTGRGLSNDERIRLAKRLAKSMMSTHLERGKPKKEPHPWKRVEAGLKKRKLIDENTSVAEKRQMCAEYYGILSELEESDSE